MADICTVVTCNFSMLSPGWTLCIADVFRMLKLLKEHKGDQYPPLDKLGFWRTVGCYMEVIHNMILVNG